MTALGMALELHESARLVERAKLEPRSSDAVAAEPLLARQKVRAALMACGGRVGLLLRKEIYIQRISHSF